ncbi:MAG: glycosyltransferase [Ignavibacteria bacterium]|nr:glycosyltransferase [Ignavibacteria bacterium]
MNPEISVITTVYNCEEYLEESIQSILNQSYKNFEYIIVNDGSSDKTPAIITKYAARDKRIKVINNIENSGRVKSLNSALGIAEGKYIAIHDADDISLPARLDLQLSFLKKNPDYVLAGSDVIVIDEAGEILSNPVRPEKDPEAKFSLIFRCTFANPSIMFRRNILSEFGISYEDDFLHAEDFRMITLISRHGKVYNMKDKLIKYRKHGSNNSSVNSKTLSNASIRIVKENLSGLGFSVSEDQVKRIRNLISSRGINSEFILEDVKLIFKIIKKFQKLNKPGRNEEILKTLRRMSKWLGRKNIITNPEYLKLQFYILTYYFKQANFKQ